MVAIGRKTWSKDQISLVGQLQMWVQQVWEDYNNTNYEMQTDVQGHQVHGVRPR